MFEVPPSWEINDVAPKESYLHFFFSLNPLLPLVLVLLHNSILCEPQVMWRYWAGGFRSVTGFDIHFLAFMLSSNGDGLLNWWGLTRPKPVLSSVRTSAPELGQLCFWAILFFFFLLLSFFLRLIAFLSQDVWGFPLPERLSVGSKGVENNTFFLFFFRSIHFFS